MRSMYLDGIIGLIIVVRILLFSPVISTANPKEHLAYWRDTYKELAPAADPLAARAQAIFNRVLRAAGTGKKAKVISLLITQNDPENISLPIAIPDGGIILSKKVLELCYQQPEQGDSRLAFILAHEIAHHHNDDFQHMIFFQSLESSRAKKPQPNKDLERLTEEIRQKELQADEYGILYAAMAGFNTTAIVTQDGHENFFVQWLNALEPSRPAGTSADRLHPSPQQRAEVVQRHLRQILDRLEVFNVGLRFYQIGKYAQAIRAFEDFARFFPSREVYHNLALSHHQRALQYYRPQDNAERLLPFKLSLALDPITRASMVLRSSEEQNKSPEELFQEHLGKAIMFYQVAISLDPSYSLSYSNFGCALLLQKDAYKAVSILQEALHRAPESPEILNNLGVAFFYAEHLKKATTHLLKAHTLAPTYDAPLFNLGKIAHIEKQDGEAQRYWREYLKLDSMSPWASTLQTVLTHEKPVAPGRSAALQGNENLMGLRIGHFEKQVPGSWGKPKEVRQLFLEQEPLRVAVYPNGVVTFSQEQEIVLIGTPQEYTSTSAGGIAIGSSAEEVLSRYGHPAKILHMTQGESWVYISITFQLRDGKVVSWLLF